MQVSLSPAQREAVESLGRPVLVSAGAGSGKTRTLTAKIAYLVNHLGFDPQRILAITFTNKAAEEMKSRLRQITGRSPQDFPWVRTFHSACFQILKEHCEELGYRRPLTIHSEYQQKVTLKKVLAQLDLDAKYLGPLRSAISRAKNLEDPRGYLKHATQIPRRLEALELYNEILAQHNAVDFDDILALTRDLLMRNPTVRETCRDLFDYVLVDEFQDSNAVQCRIMDLLVRNGNLTVVGDDYQSIYQFRGADPSHFIHFPKTYPNAHVVRLEENYRSTRPIVAAAEALISHNAHRLEKKCFSRRDGDPVEVREFLSDDQEALWVADTCRNLQEARGIPLDRMAVLYRTKFCSMALEQAMRRRGVPYKMMGGRGFFERREVQDLNAYLVCAVNPLDDVSLERILNVPKRGLGAGTLKKIFAIGGSGTPLQEKCHRALDRGLLSKKAAQSLRGLLDLLDEVRQMPPAHALRRVVDACNYEAYLRQVSTDENDFVARMENIQQMLHAANQAPDLPTYLEECALVTEEQDNEDDGYGVRLSTFHGAKGLEFEAVFVIGVEEGLLPHWRSVGSSSPGDRPEQEDLAGLEEERRLLYVAMTRAEKHIFLSHAKARKGDLVRPSRFLAELPEEHIKRHRSW
ncbi:DNA helicase-2 / ATP-dependent DNA helicase PcrA [Desulfacinum hydrothermale DSM 13146]|uniref:DNA 3'-5' helicase n=1 Tax=Desulfacinum hydrothermale DSM 13146 TaxID=1121390 RepID=A0A1W1WXE2_9BACT|nr:ATP-dependent helicase [Desulfacinum hydrothermale]SMC16392.1 DNA helicase-2 / ATP-dependent DNA helicase PcrA [Desulfacinum hydrothermale DSM 13146]